MRKIKTTYHWLSRVSLILLLLLYSNLAISKAPQNVTKDQKIDSLIRISKQDNSSVAPRDIYRITLYMYQKDSLFSAIEYAKKGIIRAESEEDYRTLGDLYIIKGYIYLSYGTYVKAIDAFSKGEQIGKEHTINALVIGANHGMGRVYNDIGEHEKAISAINIGLQLAKSNKESRELAVLYNAKGVSLQSLGNLDSANVYFNKFLQITTELGDTTSMIYALVNIGETYRFNEDFELAKQYYFKASELNKRINDSQAKAAIFGNLASIYFDQKDYKRSISFLKKSIELCSQNNGLSNYLLQDYNAIVEAFAAQNMYDSAYTYYNKYISFRDSVYESDRLQTIDNLLTEYEIAERESQAKILAVKLRNRNMILIFSFSLLILIVLLLILTYSRYKLKTKIYKEETEALNLTIDEKNRELVTRVMEQNRQTEVYEGINKTISSLENKEDTDSLKEYLTSLKISLSKKEKIGMGWDSFKLHFEQVHPDFFNKLLTQSKNLTQNDLRICGYIKLHLSTKDIANILNISDRAIQTSRYRIKKKLNLPKDVDLLKYIQNL